LIIRHGERVTEHILSDTALIVGRDPQCDLFFADKKLSRRHARFEKERGGIRLIDLGSRNGCWVNEERIQNELLTPTDSIRLGGLSISVEAESDASRAHDPREDAQESTVFISSEPSPDDSRTVVLSSSALPDAPSPDDVGTVMLTAADAVLVNEVSDDDTTLRRPPAVESPAPEQTVTLGGDAPRVAADTGTVIFRKGSARAIVGAPPIAAGSSTSHPEAFETDEPEAFETDEHDWEREASASATPSDSLRFVALVLAVAALAVAVLALPLLRTLGSALTTESALRGRALVELLAVTNEAALRENRQGALSTARIASEPGVLAAYIVDPMGRVLAPTGIAADAAGGVFASLGSNLKAEDIRVFAESEGDDGTLVYAMPVRGGGRELGIAVLQYRVGAAVSMWTTMMLVLGSLLLLMGVGTAVVLARRWTLAPVQELRDDVEALRRGIVDTVTEDRPYSDLATIARNFNELAGRGESEPAGDASTTYKPRVDPTLVPDEHGRS
jgi:pSer/pThr/pTyr-binding forkhead associated (FHA) protein